MIESKPYTALIRTYNSAPLVFRVIESLRGQTYPPAAIVVVDSGSAPAELDQLTSAVNKVVDVSQHEFNYSRAINLGVRHCETPFVLIISSHLLLNEAMVMERFLDELTSRNADVGFMVSRPDKIWLGRDVDSESFDGTNGLTNSCSFLPVSLISAIPFREEVFSAEDQEWTSRFLRGGHGRMFGIATSSISYLNPRFSYAKKLNEELALACYVDRRRLSMPRICIWMMKALWSVLKRDIDKARYRMSVAIALFRARHVMPTRSSRYFN